MTIPQLGQVQRVDLTSVWKHEARDFTPWLAEHIDLLCEVIDPNLSVIDREAPAGDFSADLIAVDERENKCIIENQLYPTDHDHLGKVLTYLAVFDAKIAVWVVAKARPEHVAAIAWLNENAGESAEFYLVTVETVRIGNSDIAPVFTLIIGPSNETQAASRDKKKLTDQEDILRRFWTDLLRVAQPITPLHAGNSASKASYISSIAGKHGHYFQYVVGKQFWKTELYIDGTSKYCNKVMFDELHSQRADVERLFSKPLQWERLDKKNASRITFRVDGKGYDSSPQEWPTIHAEMIESMVKLEESLRPAMDKNEPVVDDSDPRAAFLRDRENPEAPVATEL